MSVLIDYGRFAAILEHVEFRDRRWVLGYDNTRCYLQVEFDAPDALATSPMDDAAGVEFRETDPNGAVVQKGRKWWLSAHMTNSEIVSTALAAVLMAVEHEAREDFRYRGQAIYGPHFDVESLHALAAANATDVRS